MKIDGSSSGSEILASQSDAAESLSLPGCHGVSTGKYLRCFDRSTCMVKAIRFFETWGSTNQLHFWFGVFFKSGHYY